MQWKESSFGKTEGENWTVKEHTVAHEDASLGYESQPVSTCCGLFRMLGATDNSKCHIDPRTLPETNGFFPHQVCRMTTTLVLGRPSGFHFSSYPKPSCHSHPTCSTGTRREICVPCVWLFAWHHPLRRQSPDLSISTSPLRKFSSDLLAVLRQLPNGLDHPLSTAPHHSGKFHIASKDIRGALL